MQLPAACATPHQCSIGCAGFFLLSYAKLYKKHLHELSSGFLSGKLNVQMDPTPFR